MSTVKRHFWVEAHNINTHNCHNKLWMGRKLGITFAWGWVSVPPAAADDYERIRNEARKILGDLYDGDRFLMVYPEDRVEGGYNPKDDFKIDEATVAKIRF